MNLLKNFQLTLHWNKDIGLSWQLIFARLSTIPLTYALFEYFSAITGRKSDLCNSLHSLNHCTKYLIWASILSIVILFWKPTNTNSSLVQQETKNKGDCDSFFNTQGLKIKRKEFFAYDLANSVLLLTYKLCC